MERACNGRADCFKSVLMVDTLSISDQENEQRRLFFGMIQTHILVSLFLSAGVLFFAKQHFWSFVEGALFGLANFLSHGLVAWWIFKKKFIALSVIIIVFKYAIFGAIIYYLVRQPETNMLVFVAGVSGLIFSVTLYGLRTHK